MLLTIPNLVLGVGFLWLTSAWWNKGGSKYGSHIDSVEARMLETRLHPVMPAPMVSNRGSIIKTPAEYAAMDVIE